MNSSTHMVSYSSHFLLIGYNIKGVDNTRIEDNRKENGKICDSIGV